MNKLVTQSIVGKLFFFCSFTWSRIYHIRDALFSELYFKQVMKSFIYIFLVKILLPHPHSPLQKKRYRRLGEWHDAYFPLTILQGLRRVFLTFDSKYQNSWFASHQRKERKRLLHLPLCCLKQPGSRADNHVLYEVHTPGSICRLPCCLLNSTPSWAHCHVHYITASRTERIMILIIIIFFFFK